MSASQVVLVVKNPPANTGDVRNVCSILGSGTSPGEENDNPLQYSCLGNPMDRGAWQTIVHGVPRTGHNLMSKPPGDSSSIPGSGISPGDGNDNPLQHSCLGKFHGQKSLVGSSLWGHKESEATEHTINRTR